MHRKIKKTLILLLLMLLAAGLGRLEDGAQLEAYPALLLRLVTRSPQIPGVFNGVGRLS